MGVKIAELSKTRSRWVVVGVMLGLFLGAMEATVVATALPTIVAELHGLSLYSWPMAVYILAAAVSGPLFGKISDLYGRKRLYLGTLFLFLAGSVLSGFSHTMLQLVVFRAIQGLGAGGVLPLSIIIAGEMFPLEKRAKVQPLFSAMWGIASLVGPPLGMLLTSYSWRLVFFVNVPFGLISAWLIFEHLIEISDDQKEVKIDYIGGLLLTLGLLAFEIALPEEGGILFNVWHTALLTASLIFFSVFLLHEKKAEKPILPLQLFQFRIFSSASICQFLSGMALFGSLAFIPLYVEIVMGRGIQGAGEVLTFLLFFWVLFSGLASRLMLKIGYRILVVAGNFLVCIGFFLLSILSKNASLWQIHLAVALMGSGMGWVMAPLIVAVQSGVPRKNLGIATSALVLFRTAGASIGVSVMGSVMLVRMKNTLYSLLPTLSSSALKDKLQDIFRNPQAVMNPLLRTQLPPELLHDVRSIMAYALHGVFQAALFASLLAFFAGFLVPKGKAQEHVYREEAEGVNVRG
jgi:EmrB/QacA subfamily drug resistance transporter